jgi:hypothetical protein
MFAYSCVFRIDQRTAERSFVKNDNRRQNRVITIKEAKQTDALFLLLLDHNMFRESQGIGKFHTHNAVGRNSSVSLVTRYELDVTAIESPWGVKFSTHVHTAPWTTSVV